MNLERIAINFTYHPPEGHEIAKYKRIRERAHDLAILIWDDCPDSRERSLAFTKLEEVVMWANASIARGRDEG